MLSASHQGDVDPALHDYLCAPFEVYVHPGFSHQRDTHSGMTAKRDGQVVIAVELNAAIKAHRVMLFGFEHRDAVARNGFFALTVDLQVAVVFDVLLQVALGVEVDLFLAFAVFEA